MVTLSLASACTLYLHRTLMRSHILLIHFSNRPLLEGEAVRALSRAANPNVFNWARMGYFNSYLIIASERQ